MIEYNICYSLDSKYTEQLAVSICSILRNSDENENINFYILDGGLTEQDKLNLNLLKKIRDFSIKYIKINYDEFAACPLLKEKDEKYLSYHVSLPTYFRFKLPSLIENIDKILYLDCDVIVKSSLKELFSMNVQNNAALMVPDAENKKESKRLGIKNYYNAGVMLINLEYWRKNNVQDKLFEYAKQNYDKILWQDQDIVNVVLQNEIKGIDNIFNYQFFLYEKIDSKKISESVILHLAGRFKPWLMAFEHPVYDYYYYYLSFTPWKNKIIEYKQNSTGKILKNNIGGSKTNILINATDEDIQKVYGEIDKSYKYCTETRDLLNARIDVTGKEITDYVLGETRNDISKVYDEISKNYDYTNQILNLTKEEIDKVRNSFEELSIETVFREHSQQITNLYTEITNNYEYTNKLNSDLYAEISKNYDFTKQLNSEIKEELETNKQQFDNAINSVSNNLTAAADEKITKVYEEISNNYDYTNSLSRQIYERITQTDNNSLSHINSAKKDINTLTDDKISKVYDEISKNYDYTNTLLKKAEEELKQSFESKLEQECNILGSRINENNAKNDNDIANIYDKIALTTGKITSDIENINNELISRAEYETVKTDEKISLVYDEITKNYKYTEKLVDDLNYKTTTGLNIVNNELSYINSVVNDNFTDVRRKSDNRTREVYSYINEQVSGLYNEVDTVQKLLDGKIDKKSLESFQRIIQIEDKIKNLYDAKADKFLVNTKFLSSGEKINNIEVKYQEKLDKIEKMFEEKLNNQRIKYEKKLIEMEKIIEALDSKYQPLKLGLFDRLKKNRKK